jgi:hypothetical protein
MELGRAEIWKVFLVKRTFCAKVQKREWAATI